MPTRAKNETTVRAAERSSAYARLEVMRAEILYPDLTLDRLAGLADTTAHFVKRYLADHGVLIRTPGKRSATPQKKPKPSTASSLLRRNAYARMRAIQVEKLYPQLTIIRLAIMADTSEHLVKSYLNELGI